MYQVHKMQTHLGWLKGTGFAVALFICALIAFALALAVARFIADRQPASIMDIPIYPGAQKLNYPESPKEVEPGCFTVLYRAPDKPEAVQAFYKDIYNVPINSDQRLRWKALW